MTEAAAPYDVDGADAYDGAADAMAAYMDEAMRACAEASPTIEGRARLMAAYVQGCAVIHAAIVLDEALRRHTAALVERLDRPCSGLESGRRRNPVKRSATAAALRRAGVEVF